MLKIPYSPPQLPRNQVENADASRVAMTGMVTRLEQWIGNNPVYAAGKLLQPDDRALLAQTWGPTLASTAVISTAGVREHGDTGWRDELRVMAGVTSAAFDASLYASADMKQWLTHSHLGRCAYCESLVQHVSWGDVEHFRPKAGWGKGEELYRPAYYFLAYTPDNLLYACVMCNEAYKKNEFPITGVRARERADLDAELPVLIQPYVDDPRNHIRFNPLNGSAYPWDVVKAFYSDTAPQWTSGEIQARIWADPRLIPQQSTTAPGVDSAFARWVTQLDIGTANGLARGGSSIAILGLNRATLLRARVAHLRQLRALAIVSNGDTPEALSARQLIATILQGDDNAVRAVVQYASASIDALRSWMGAPDGTLQPLQVNWLDVYNRMVDVFPAPPAGGEPIPANDALCYLLTAADFANTRSRRLVFITDADADAEEVHGYVGTDAYYTLAVDWDADADKNVVIRRPGKPDQVIALRDFIKRRITRRTFRGAEITVNGTFPSFDPRV